MLRRSTNEILHRLASSTVPFQVEHDITNKYFYIQLSDSKASSNARAVLEYALLPNGALDLYHTEVPSALRGHGIAAKLVQAVFEHCVKENLFMKLSCTYVQKYYNENKLAKYSALVIE